MADTPLDPRTLRATPKSFVSEVRQDNPGVSDKQITDAWFEVLSKHPDIAQKYAADTGPETGGVRSTLRSGFNTVRDFTNAVTAKAGQFTPVDAAQALLSRATGGAVPSPSPIVPDEAAARFAQRVVPQTPAGAVVQAMPVVAPLARMGLLARAGIGAAAGAGANAATGENPGIGAVEGAAGQAIPAAAGQLARAGRWALGIRPTAAQTALVSEAKSGDFARSLQQDVPSLWNQIKDIPGSVQKKLLSIHDPAVVQKALRAPIEDVEGKIAKAVPAVANPFPTAAAAAPERTAVQKIYDGASAETKAAMRAANPGVSFEAPAAAADTVPTSKAIDTWRTAAEDARAARAAGNPVEGRTLQQTADKWEQAIMDAAPDELAGQWRAARAEFGRGMRYQELHQPSLQGAAGGVETTPFNHEGVAGVHNANPSDYSESALPGLHAHYWGGAEPGTQPAVNDLGGYIRPPLMSAHGGFHLPLGATRAMPGEQPGAGYEAAKSVLESLARQGTIGLGNQTAEPSPLAPAAAE